MSVARGGCVEGLLAVFVGGGQLGVADYDLCGVEDLGEQAAGGGEGLEGGRARGLG